MKIFVINLDRSTERLKTISSRLLELGLEYERISAVDGKKMEDYTARFNLDKFLLESKHQLVPGEAGCAESHINVWTEVIRRNLPYALVLEDDVIISAEIREILNNSCYFENFDYLKLDNPIDKIEEALHCKGAEIYEKSIQKKTMGRFKLLELDPVPYGTGGYIISQKACRIFLKRAAKMYFPVDILPRYTFPYTTQGVLLPNVVSHQEERNSDIEERTFNVAQNESSLIENLQKIFSSRFLRRAAVQWIKTRVYFENTL